MTCLQIHQAVREQLLDFGYDPLVQAVVPPSFVEAAVHLGPPPEIPSQGPVVRPPCLKRNSIKSSTPSSTHSSIHSAVTDIDTVLARKTSASFSRYLKPQVRQARPLRIRKGGWGTNLDIGLDVRQGGCPPEGQDDVLPVPGHQALGVQALFPEQLILVQCRLEQAASLRDRVLAALNLQRTVSRAERALLLLLP